MAFVTVKRAQSVVSDKNKEDDATDGNGAGGTSKQTGRAKASLRKLKKFFTAARFVHKLRFNDNYLAIKGAALILPKSECKTRSHSQTDTGDIQSHLEDMIQLLRPEDTLQAAIKLECLRQDYSRYLCVVTTSGQNNRDESVILGFDIKGNCPVIGLALPVWADLKLTIDGDGGFVVRTCDDVSVFRTSEHNFKPVSVQAMWSGFLCLCKVRDLAYKYKYLPGGTSHAWVHYYEDCLTSDPIALKEWNFREDLDPTKVLTRTLLQTSTEAEFRSRLLVKLKDIMLQIDLEDATTKSIRERLEQDLCQDLSAHSTFISNAVLEVFGQMGSPSQILDYLYLGSEWNASNLEELQSNDVKYILNVTREIDNFYPRNFKYLTIHEWDKEDANLLQHWDNTHKFISKARESGHRILVHCKMGVSRSASTVIAYIMKNKELSFSDAYSFVKKRRSCIKPNEGFERQLKTYEGMLRASNQRALFRSRSVNQLVDSSHQLNSTPTRISAQLLQAPQDPPPVALSPSVGGACQEHLGVRSHLRAEHLSMARPSSWSPRDDGLNFMENEKNPADESVVEGCNGEELSTRLATPATNSPDEAEVDEVFDDLVFPFSPEDLDLYESSSISTEEGEQGAEKEQRADSSSVTLLRCDHVTSPPHSPSSSPPTTPPTDQATGSRSMGCYDVYMLTTPAVTPSIVISFEDEPPREAEDHTEYPHPDELVEAAMTEFRRRVTRLRMSQVPDGRREEWHGSGAGHDLDDGLSSGKSTFYIEGGTITESSTQEWTENSGIFDCTETTESRELVVVTYPNQSEKTPEVKDSDLITEVKDSDLPAEVKDSDLSTEVKDSDLSAEVKDSDLSTEVKDSDLSTEVKDSDLITEVKDSHMSTEVKQTDFEADVKDTDQRAEVTTGRGPGPIEAALHTPDDSPSQQRPDCGIRDYFHKEEIPWSPGTVRRATREMEQKFRSLRIVGDEDEQRAGVSVYEKEEIGIEPGIVEKTRRELERKDSMSIVWELESPVQRSSSWKQNERRTGRFDRNSERRRTTVPVMRLVRQRQMEGGDSHVTQDVTVMRFVTVQKTGTQTNNQCVTDVKPGSSLSVHAQPSKPQECSSSSSRVKLLAESLDNQDFGSETSFAAVLSSERNSSLGRSSSLRALNRVKGDAVNRASSFKDRNSPSKRDRLGYPSHDQSASLPVSCDKQTDQSADLPNTRDQLAGSPKSRVPLLVSCDANSNTIEKCIPTCEQVDRLPRTLPSPRTLGEEKGGVQGMRQHFETISATPSKPVRKSASNVEQGKQRDSAKYQRAVSHEPGALDPEDSPRRNKRLHGPSHPLSKLG